MRQTTIAANNLNMEFILKVADKLLMNFLQVFKRCFNYIKIPYEMKH